jgi:hypothetical protein
MASHALYVSASFGIVGNQGHLKSTSLTIHWFLIRE